MRRTGGGQAEENGNNLMICRATCRRESGDSPATVKSGCSCICTNDILGDNYSCDDSTRLVCAVQIILVRRWRYTCVCLPFSGASLVGREEYMVEDSPSFLGSTGLFGRSGKPKGRG